MRGSAEPVPTATSAAPWAEDPLEAFATAAIELVRGASLDRAFAALARATAHATGAQVVLARVLDDRGESLVTRAVHADSPALAAELEGTRVAADQLGSEELEFAAAPGDPEAPPAIRRAASQAGASHALIVPVAGEDGLVGSLDLLRSGAAFSPRERALARVAAAHFAGAIRAELAAAAGGQPELTQASLELLGEVLAAGADESETAEQVVRLAAEATGASAAAVWRLETDADPAFLAGDGIDARRAPKPILVEGARGALHEPAGLPEGAGGRGIVTLPLGEPPSAALQLFFDDEPPDDERLDRLSPFAARASVALRRTHRVKLLNAELKRSQTLVAVVSQAIAQLSLAHTLETAVERVAELTSSKHVAVYLREGERLSAAASRGLSGAHTELAERLLELALGPYRSRGYLLIEDMRADPRLGGLRSILEQSGVRRALFIPLVVHEEVTGALGVFRGKPRPYREGEEELLIALSSQLAVAVQNARLHEQTKELGTILERTLESERRAARQLGGLYAISQSFAESLSFDATLDAVARTMVELFDVHAATVRVPSERGEELETRVVHVADENLRGPVESIFSRPQPVGGASVRRLAQAKRPLLLRPGAPDSEAEPLLEPFLRQGATAAVLPLATPAEMLGTLTLVSLDPTRPLRRESVAAATSITAQAALAIDNARLYQQQKAFAETMQRSLLPRDPPAVPGLDVGHVYQSSARVDVGGDVYDFLVLDEHRLAVVVGDVLGKGIQATADMAMAKFSFRALARSHPDPSDFLASANEVVVEEIEPGKFVTLAYALVDSAEREVAFASAGHPPARVVTAGGEVFTVTALGLALGIEPRQRYDSERIRLEAGSTIVLYTDGVIEARRNGELYGEVRLDRLLAELRGLGAQQLAEAILEDCRAFSRGDLGDDCAVVCLELAP